MNKSYEIRVKVYDAMGVQTNRYTRWYQTYTEAYKRAKKLERKYYGRTARARFTEETREVA